MPNYCDFSIKVVGSKENCDKFFNLLDSYDDNNHFWRIFEAYVADEYNNDTETSMYICGYCAWSLETCCRASGYSKGIDLFEINTRNLNLKMEAYSREPGVGFEEHYIYEYGECVEDECRDIETFFWDTGEYPTYTEFKNEYPDAPPEEQFEDTNEAYTGGFGDHYEEWSI